MFLHKVHISLLYIRGCPVCFIFVILSDWRLDRILMYLAWVSKAHLCLIFMAGDMDGDPGLLRPVLGSRVCVG